MAELQAKGLYCGSESMDRYTLERVSYYRLKPYLRLLERHIMPSHQLSLKHAYDLWAFDRCLSSIAFKYIGIFETQMKARYVQLMGKAHGPFSWLNPTFFLRSKLHEDTVERIKREIHRQAAKGYRKTLSANPALYEDAPIWIMAECASFGSISKLYANTADAEITDAMAVFFNSNKSRLSSWLKTITDVRNICAHFNPFVVLNQIPSVPKRDPEIAFPHTSPIYIFPMLESLLFSSEPGCFDDPNLLYSERLNEEFKAQVSDYSAAHPSMMPWITEKAGFSDLLAGS